ncbi:MAG: PHP domain-containing protein [Desulfobacterales bacterium]
MDCEPQLKIDLHVHSSASDGSLTPRELLALAEKEHLSALALTDHDTLDGAREAIRLAPAFRVKFTPGVEISAGPPVNFAIQGSLHILGYGIDLEDRPLNQALKLHQNARKNRNPKILERLKSEGLALEPAEIIVEAGGGQIGRPHIAQAMVRKGWVATIDEAFDRYLGKGAPAYVDKYRIPCEETIALITTAGGLAVLAHPQLYGVAEDGVLEELIIHLKGAGLGGLEVFYSQHTLERTARFAFWAGRHGLLMTGGSDFHGSINPHISLGYLQEKCPIPGNIYGALAAACPGIPAL